MTSQTDRWDRCKALAAELKRLSLETQQLPETAAPGSVPAERPRAKA